MEHVISTDSTPIAVWRSGSGPPLLLVHGASADHTRWPWVLAGFEQHFTVYNIDRRGRGASGDAEAHSLEQEGEDITAVIDSIEEPVNVLGHSYGANCCLEAALLTSNIQSLVLYEPDIPNRLLAQPGISDDTRDKLEMLLQRGDREAVLITLLREVAGMSEDQLDATRADPSWPDRVAAAHTVVRELRAVEDADRPDFLDRFRSIQVPALLLLGGDSPPFAHETAAQLDAVLPNSRIHVMPGQEHLAMAVISDEFVEIVRSFCLW